MTKNVALTTSKVGVGFRQQMILLAIAMAAIATMPVCAIADSGAQATKLVVQEERTSDGAIHRDNGVYRDTQQRIKKLNDGGRRVADYQLSKAQCWLDVSFHEYSRNDRGNFPQEALSESQRIISTLEKNQDAGQETPLVNGAEKLRLDLWARYELLKKHGGYQCATQQTACAEVELVHAGNEIHEAGWRHAKPYVQIAEDLIGAAEKAAASCVPAVVPTAVILAPAVTPALPVPATLIKEKIVLSADALFYFDKSGNGDLLPKGRVELDDLAQKISAGRTGVISLDLVGYTDRLGAVAYNFRLSKARANTVKVYLQEHGVSVPISVNGRGLQDQIIACKGISQSTVLHTCLQPNRRVEVFVTQLDQH
ncbi:OmpA family protein [Undibacterium sp. Ren11W]|uniref:OmpA family protein n=1 Tax=Undibacterium sp. Ren11W TaxID=3413045 RepID=UPI003BF2295B